MRNSVLSLTVLATALVTSTACSKSDSPPAADTAAPTMAAAPASPAPSAPLAAADLSGTWTGTTYAVPGDSVLTRFTLRMVDATNAMVVNQAGPDSTHYAVRYDADSVIATSDPLRGPISGRMVHYHNVGRLRDGKLIGTSWATPVDGDSVLSRWRFEATRAP